MAPTSDVRTTNLFISCHETPAMLTTIASFGLIARDLDRSLELTSQQPTVSRETAYYLENITSIKSADEFVDDDRLFRYAMTAHGLEEMSYAKAFMRKVLNEGVDASDSFANGLADQRYRDFAETFNFARYGETATAFTRTQQGTADLYIRQTMEIDAGNENEGVRLALYFQRKAPELTSVFGILADRAMLEVVQTALSIPPEASLQDIDRQAEAIGNRIDLEDFKDPEKLGRFLQQFSALWDIKSPQANTSASVPSISIGAPIQYGLSSSLLTQIQGLKIGNR